MIGLRTFVFFPYHPFTTQYLELELIQIIEYNPRYFDEPEEYKPSRWHNISNDEAFSAFNIGMHIVFFRSTVFFFLIIIYI